MANGIRLSVAIPIHNEESVLPELLSRLQAVLNNLSGGPHELVFVDDGSTDRSFEMLERAADEDPRIVAISLSRNFGHQAAITAALDHVSGDATIVMDGDLQDVPEVIPAFVEKFQQGFDVVYAQRVRRKEPVLLRACYFLFYRLMASLSDIRLPLDSGDFGLMSRRVVDQFLLCAVIHPLLIGGNENIRRRALLDLFHQRRTGVVAHDHIDAALLGEGGIDRIERVLQRGGAEDQDGFFRRLALRMCGKRQCNKTECGR